MTDAQNMVTEHRMKVWTNDDSRLWRASQDATWHYLYWFSIAPVTYYYKFSGLKITQT